MSGTWQVDALGGGQGDSLIHMVLYVWKWPWPHYIFFKILFIFRERRGRKRERNTDVREKHQLVASCMPPTGDLATT